MNPLAAFVLRECALLDARAFQAFVDSFAPDGVYEVCTAAGATLVSERADRLAARVLGRQARSEVPPSRTRRIPGFPQVDGGTVVTPFLLRRLQRDRDELYSGVLVHELVDGLRIAHRRVILDDEVVGTLGFVL